MFTISFDPIFLINCIPKVFMPAIPYALNEYLPPVKPSISCSHQFQSTHLNGKYKSAEHMPKVPAKWKWHNPDNLAPKLNMDFQHQANCTHGNQTIEN